MLSVVRDIMKNGSLYNEVAHLSEEKENKKIHSVLPCGRIKLRHIKLKSRITMD